jgi:hypothetical protein
MLTTWTLILALGWDRSSALQSVRGFPSQAACQEVAVEFVRTFPPLGGGFGSTTKGWARCVEVQG